MHFPYKIYNQQSFYTANILKKSETIKFFMLKYVNIYKINF